MEMDAGKPSDEKFISGRMKPTISTVNVAP
jgi:hypothetical protein